MNDSLKKRHRPHTLLNFKVLAALAMSIVCFSHINAKSIAYRQNFDNPSGSEQNISEAGWEYYRSDDSQTTRGGGYAERTLGDGEGAPSQAGSDAPGFAQLFYENGAYSSLFMTGANERTALESVHTKDGILFSWYARKDDRPYRFAVKIDDQWYASDRYISEHDKLWQAEELVFSSSHWHPMDLNAGDGNDITVLENVLPSAPEGPLSSLGIFVENTEGAGTLNFDSLEVKVDIPESETFALLTGSLGFVLIAVRRRR